MMVWINPAKGVFVENVLLHPNLNVSLTFPENWVYANQILLMKAVNSEQKSSITVGIERTQKSPKVLGKELIKKLELKDNGRNLTIEKRELLINDSSAYLLKVSEQINREVMTVSIIWLARGDLVFKFISVSTTDIETLMLDCAGSLREITAAEKVNINEFRLRFTDVSGNETFDDFCRISGNVLNEEMWRVLNDWDAERKFTENEKVKVIIRDPYYQ